MAGDFLTQREQADVERDEKRFADKMPGSDETKSTNPFVLPHDEPRLRERALELANSAEAPDVVVKRAEAYLTFLKGHAEVATRASDDPLD